MKSTPVVWLLLAAVGCCTATASGEAGWPQFRGPLGSGVSPHTGLSRSWPAGGPEVLWRRPLGEGFSGLVVVGERVYALYARGGDEYAAGFRVTDGSEVWRRRIGEKLADTWGNGPRATPATNGERLYALSSNGVLFALGAADGEMIWRVDLAARFGSPNRPQAFDAGLPQGAVPLGPYWGYCSSPLLVGDLLVVYTGAGGGNSLVAFDETSGTKRWGLFDHLMSYSSPFAVEVGGVRQIVLAMAGEIVSVGTSGEVLWRHPWARFNVSQPVFLPPGRLFFSSPNDVGAVLLELATTPGGARVKELWRQPRMRNHWQSSVAYDGSILGFDNATLKCLTAGGEVLWARRGLGKGSVVAADGLFFVLSDRGMLTLAEWSTEGYRETGRFKVLDDPRPSWTAPSLAQGKLFLRNHREMVCLDLENDR